MTRSGKRLIKEFVSADRMREIVADLERRFPQYKGRVFPLCLGFWHDGVAMTYRLSAHPCLLFILNVSADFLQCDVNVIRLGTTSPALNKRFWPKGAGNLGSFKKLVQFARHQSLDLIMEEVWYLNRTGFIVPDFRCDSGEILREALVVPYCVLVNVDLQQAWLDMGIKPCGNLCHLSLLASRDDFADPEVRTYPVTRYERIKLVLICSHILSDAV